MMAVVVCAVVTMAATGGKDGDFDAVVARQIYVRNDAGQFVVTLGVDDDGNGLVYTKSAKGKESVTLTSSVGNAGMVSTYQANGKELVRLGATENGGLVSVSNKTGEAIVDLNADEYGNGVVGAWNRKGKGRTLKPGP